MLGSPGGPRELKPRELLPLQRLPEHVHAIVLENNVRLEELIKKLPWTVVTQHGTLEAADAHVVIMDVDAQAPDWVQISRHCEQVWAWLLQGRPALVGGIQRFPHVAALCELVTWFPAHPVGPMHWFGDLADLPSL